MTQDPAAVQTYLARHEIFQLLPKDALAALGQACREESYAPDQILFQQGDPGPYCLVILTGQVRVHVTEPGGKDMLIVTLGPGDVLGEMALLDGGVRSASASAMDAVRALKIMRVDFEKTLLAHPDALLALMRLLCARLRATDEQLMMIALQDLPARLAHYLLKRAARLGDHAAMGAAMPIGMKQGDLADHLATSRESINKLLNAWQARGLVTLMPSRAIVLQDVAGLRQIADPFAAAETNH